MTPKDIRAEIISLIRKETEFLRHYIGEVSDVEDPIKKGRIKVMIPERGWDTDDLAIWCYPRFVNQMSVPAKGDWVEVYFIDGDSSRPVWLGIAHEISDMVVKNYDGTITDHILFEDPNDEDNYIKYDAEQKQLDLLTDGNTIILLAGTESYVLGETFVTWLANFINSEYTVHVHNFTGVGPGNPGTTLAPTVAGTAPTNSDFLSEDIKGK